MTTLDKLQELINRCRCGVYVSVNEHRDVYQTAQQRILEWRDECQDSDIPAEVLNTMIERNTIVEVQFYPDTPIGFYRVRHYDLESALDIALDGLEAKR
jgi:hypothetical protein